MISNQNIISKMEGLDLAAITLTNITRFYYHHEIQGLEKIPSTGAAILVYYHGVILVDYVALVARLYMRDGRMVNSVVHKLLAALPGWQTMERKLKLTAASRDHYAALLEAGEMVGVAVGGAEEALFDWDYDLLWGNRTGFATLALRTGRMETKDIRYLGHFMIQELQSSLSLLRTSARLSRPSLLEVS